MHITEHDGCATRPRKTCGFARCRAVESPARRTSRHRTAACSPLFPGPFATESMGRRHRRHATTSIGHDSTMPADDTALAEPVIANGHSEYGNAPRIKNGFAEGPSLKQLVRPT